MERVKTKLRALNPIHQKRIGIERGTSSESVNQKKLTLAPPKSHPVGPVVPCGECERTNHATPKCQVGTNKCM